MIASDKMTFELFINKITNDSEKKEAEAISKKINAILEDDVSGITDTSKREVKIKENENKINSYLERISKIASKYFKFSTLPVSKIQFESASIGGGVMGKKMLAFPLTKNHPTGSESDKDTSNPAYNKVEQRGYMNGSFYVKGHLLNNNLGGPGSWINYTPFREPSLIPACITRNTRNRSKTLSRKTKHFTTKWKPFMAGQDQHQLLAIRRQ